MPAAPQPFDEAARIAALEAYDILDSMPEQVFDDITFLASEICGTPIALISLVDTERQWFKSRVGLDVGETHRDLAFCAHAILEPEELLVVTDARDDDRFADNPLVHDGVVRFYAGAPLQTDAAHSALGTLCVIDHTPRQLDDRQQAALAALSRQVMGQLELRKTMRDLQRHQKRLERYQQKLEEANDQLARLRLTDGLTGIANRAAFDERLETEVARARRYGTPLSLLVLDLDHFKRLNDEYGHTAGDDVLARVARVIDERGRSTDFVARLGGEEFTVILTGTDLDGAAILAERYRRAVAEADCEHGPVTVSIGLAEFSPNDATPRDFFDRADAALYRAKAAGRDRVAEAG